MGGSNSLRLRGGLRWGAGMVLLHLLCTGFCCILGEQSSTSGNPQQLVQQVIDNELTATRNDHSHWMYRDAYKSPSKDVVMLVVETSQGTIKKLIESNGQPPGAPQQSQDRAKMEKMVNDPAERSRQRKDSAHDDEQSVALMKMLPNAFLWKEVSHSGGEITLRFQPNPAFQPPTYASRVFAAMAGDMVVNAKQKRLKMLDGKLIQPVEFGWGLFGRLQPGGTFRIVRSEIGPGIWQITETHVHINGRVLFFKSIGQQEDETSTGYKPAPSGLTLQQAAKMLDDGEIAKELGVHPAP